MRHKRSESTGPIAIRPEGFSWFLRRGEFLYLDPGGFIEPFVPGSWYVVLTTRRLSIAVDVRSTQFFIRSTKYLERNTLSVVLNTPYFVRSAGSATRDSSLTRACSHYSQPISDECEVDESD